MKNKKATLKILRQVLGPDKITSKDEHYFKCPACGHHKRKFAVNFTKGAYHCWVCDYRGRNLRRIVRRFGSYTQLQKWDQITNRSDLERFADLFMEPERGESDQKLELPEEFVSLCSNNIPATGMYALRYLEKRGVSRADILKWKIGYCFSGEYKNRIIIPSFDHEGDVSYFIARSYTGDSYKYKNPRASKDITFNELYIDWNKDLVLVEGVFDALVAGNAAPILGSTLRKGSKLLREIVRNDTPIYIALDPDAAKKERRVIKTLLEYDVELYKIDVSGYEDVGSMPRDVFQQRKNKATFIDSDNYLLLDLLSAV
jgi:DNA primase